MLAYNRYFILIFFENSNFGISEPMSQFTACSEYFLCLPPKELNFTVKQVRELLQTKLYSFAYITVGPMMYGLILVVE